MKSLVVYSLVGIFLLVACLEVRADCDEPKGPDDSDLGQFFKKVGCQVKKGAEELSEAAKPYADKIAEGAKSFGSKVAENYDTLKHKLTDESSTTPRGQVPYDAPTEKVPLAPIAPSSPPAL
ncbi:hypothetical protein KR009_005015 [Drosophila setifemur]|nr:hypothetical protein KR009_005015 [Drosophila setifemur]